MTWPGDFINKIICGDCLDVMKKMPAASVDMCLTSPPYWGLRDYGVEQIFGGDADCEHEWERERILGARFAQDATRRADPTRHCLKCGAWKGQLGLEPTPELYIEHMTEIFHEVKRVLKKEGTLWLNIGDTYSSSGGAGGDYNNGGLKEGQPKYKQGTSSLQPKCLCMIPERLVWSLIQDGWILRNKIVWYKPNGMPSSVKDRFSNKWEYIYLFSQSKKYYFDLDAVRENFSVSSIKRISQVLDNQDGGIKQRQYREQNIIPTGGDLKQPAKI